MKIEIDEPIHIEHYQKEWVTWHAEEKKNLLKVLPFLPEHCIEHFGSTAVKGLDAKPIIDILIGYQDSKTISNIIENLEKSGYEYLGEAGVPGRDYFRKRGIKSYNIALVEYGGSLWIDNILIRDYLNTHPDYAKEYGKLKQKIVDSGFKELLSYSNEKSTFMIELLRKARKDKN